MMKLIIICSILILFTGKVNSFGLSYLTNIQDVIEKTDPTLTAVNKLSEEIRELTQIINVKMDKLMNAVLVNLPRAIQLANFMRKLIDYIGRIDELYEDYLFYVRKFGQVNKYTIEEFSNVLTSHKYGALPDVLKQAYHLFLPGRGNQEEDSLIDVMMASLESLTTEEHCNILKTSQQQMYDLYEAITISEIKGHTMATYAYGVLAIHQNTSFDREIERVTGQTISRCTEYFTAILDALGRLTRDVFLCDPPVHIKGETHVELNAITRIMTHEFMMYDNCNNVCPDINRYKHKKAYILDKKDSWDPNQPCLGRIYNCDNSGDSRFCELTPEYGKRYSWVKSANSGMLGPRDDCKNGTERVLFETRSWYRCDPCFCECSEEEKDSKAIRTFSLRPQIADIDNNMIVTGVRFEEKDMMIHVQIEQGKLLPAGQIEKSSIRWKELEDFRYSYDSGDFFKVDGDYEKKLVDGIDYQFIRYKQRDVYLDDVYSRESGYVVTGLKMTQDPENSKAIQLEVYLTSFDFFSGLVKPTDDNPSKWITHRDMVEHNRLFTQRKELDVTDLRRGDDYTDNVPDTGDFWDVWFVISSKWADASQSTVPFLDRQTAAPFPRVALSGVSLFHRGKNDCGGFIGFKLKTINLYDYMSAQVKPEFAKQHLKSFEKLLNTSMITLET